MILALTYDLLKGNQAFTGLGTTQIGVCIIGLFFTCIASFLASTSPTRSVITMSKAPSVLLFTISLVIMGINIYGLMVPLRNPQVYHGVEYAGINRSVKYTVQQVVEQMNRNEAIDEQYPDYVKRLNQLIFDGTVHYWDEEKGDNSFHLYIPLQENYLIYLLQILSDNNTPYEFCQAERAIERAASVCSQSAKIVTNILTRNKVKAQIVTLDEHVIVRARVEKQPETWWILDADYGVVLEHDLDQVTKDPDIIRAAYAAHGYGEDVIDKLVQIYAPPGNQVTDDGLLCHHENHLYVLKWLIPALGLLPQTIFVILHRFKKSNTRRT